MKSSYKKLGEYLELTDERNYNLAITNLQGVSIEKVFIPSIANIIGTDLSSYKIVRKGQFAYGPVTSRNGDKVSIALLKGEDCIISSSYTSFKISKPDELLPEYLMLWFMRPEFDRYARFMSNGSAREVFDWECMCGVELPVPSIEEQQKIVRNNRIIADRIELLKKINSNLYSHVEALFKELINSKANDEKLPLNWEREHLNKICNIVYGKGLPTNELLNNGYIVYGGNGPIGFYDKYLYKDRMVIVSCRGAASGNVIATRPYSYVTSNSLVLEINDECKTPFEFLLYSSYHANFESKVSGSAQPQLTIDNLKDVYVIVPDNQTMELFTQKSKKILEYIYKNEEEIDKLRSMLKAVLSKLI